MPQLSTYTQSYRKLEGTNLCMHADETFLFLSPVICKNLLHNILNKVKNCNI